MPNWCDNCLMIEVNDAKHKSGLLKEIQNFTGDQGNSLDFNKIVPVPSEIKSNKKKVAFVDLEQETIEANGHDYQHIWQIHDNTCVIENTPGSVDMCGRNDWYLDMLDNHHDRDKYLMNKYGAINEYDFRVEVWGTKSWGEELNMSHNKEFIYMNFQTAWGPCYGIFFTLAQKFFVNENLIYRWYEGGVGCLGEFTSNKSKLNLNEKIYINEKGLMNEESYLLMTDFFGENPDDYKKNKEGLYSYDPDDED